jgi:hypothetical protein
LDEAAGVNGFITTDFDGGDDRAYAVSVQPDGKVILAGDSEGQFALARYWPDLTVDVIDKISPAFYNLNISPNPTSDILNVELPANANPTTLRIFDIRGRLVDVQAFTKGQPLSVEYLPSGMYSLKMTDGEQVYMGKFVKQ